MREHENWNDDNVVKWLDDAWTKNGEGSLKTVLSLLRRFNPPSLLDVGSGTGRIYQYGYDSRVPESHRLTGKYRGEDITPAMLAHATAKFGPHFHQGDIYSLAHRDNTFHSACCVQILPHLPEIERPIKELMRVVFSHLFLVTWVANGRTPDRDPANPEHMVNVNIPGNEAQSRFIEVAHDLADLQNALECYGSIVYECVEPNRPTMDLATFVVAKHHDHYHHAKIGNATPW